MNPTEIEYLQLSNRAKNILYNNGIFTIIDLANLDKDKLKNFYGIGKKTYDEIIEKKETINIKKTSSNSTIDFSKTSFVLLYTNDDYDITNIYPFLSRTVKNFITEKKIHNTAEFVQINTTTIQDLYTKNQLSEIAEKLQHKTTCGSDLIQCLLISQKLKRFLFKNNCKTISDFYTNDYKQEILHFEGLGKKTLAEYSYLKEILSPKAEQDFVKANIYEIRKRVLSAVTNIDSLNFSHRTKNVLNKHKIKTLMELEKLSYSDFKTFDNFGKKSYNEIQDIITSFYQDNNINLIEKCFLLYDEPYTFLTNLNTIDCEKALRNTSFINISEYLKQNANSFGKNPIDYFIYKDKKNTDSNYSTETLDTILNYFEQFLTAQEIDQISFMLSLFHPKDWFTLCPELLLPIKNEILLILSENFLGINIQVLLNKLSGKLDKSIIESILVNMTEKSEIQLKEECYSIQYPKVRSYIKEIKDPRCKDICYKKIIKGMSLEEIGNYYSLTRERIRQIIKKAFANSPEFEEDKYRFIYETYRFSLEQIKYLFGDETGFYLRTFCFEGDLDIEESLSDERIPQNIRRKIERKIIYSNYAKIGKNYIRLKRTSLFDFYVKKYCREESDLLTVIDDFNNNFLIKNKIDLKFKVEYRSFVNKFVTSKTVLYKGHNKFRYYPFSEFDFTELIEQINIDQFKNIEISTRKLFKQHSKLMRKYLIKDEYELHNLLRKIYEGTKDIDFKRMPTICFGEANREKQIYELLLEKSPISFDELAMAYENEFGVNANTVKINILPIVSKYLYRGTYSFEELSFSTSELTKLKTILKEDYYDIDSFFSEIKTICPNRLLFDITPVAIRNLGFLPFDKYVVSNKYSSATEYFESLLCKQEIVNLSDIREDIRKNGHFYNILSNYKNNLLLIEFEKDVYINLNRLNKKGISKSDFNYFANNILRNEDIPPLFTVKMIRNILPDEELFELGFEDLFYENILATMDDKFSYSSLGKIKVFSKNRDIVTYETIIKNIIGRKMNIDRVIEELEYQYGIKIMKSVLVAKLEDSDLYYDKIMGKIYIDYELYIEEI